MALKNTRGISSKYKTIVLDVKNDVFICTYFLYTYIVRFPKMGKGAILFEWILNHLIC